MKNDDSCCQSGANKNFKGNKCGCSDVEIEKGAIVTEDDQGCCGNDMKEEKVESCGSGGCGCR